MAGAYRRLRTLSQARASEMDVSPRRSSADTGGHLVGAEGIILHGHRHLVSFSVTVRSYRMGNGLVRIWRTAGVDTGGCWLTGSHPKQTREQRQTGKCKY
ncbi:hypothetical protein E2562_033091 [Oryza meyeriana var. granulata]|uniref:Uncharacterized protein n=1 Tax=Oryza meyeriana var. granulata TaxID=110450 RepID=A0A6G1DQX1_9ORYZ|nr:hypothetical protein E2562_033091 [Oryza meyeriana var. granulata]